MTHNENRQVWYKEGLLTLITGTVYGATSVIVGHPMDTVKTKMQAMDLNMKSGGPMSITKDIWKN